MEFEVSGRERGESNASLVEPMTTGSGDTKGVGFIAMVVRGVSFKAEEFEDDELSSHFSFSRTVSTDVVVVDGVVVAVGVVVVDDVVVVGVERTFAFAFLRTRSARIFSRMVSAAVGRRSDVVGDDTLEVVGLAGFGEEGVDAGLPAERSALILAKSS